jgi:hypothetical protein
MRALNIQIVYLKYAHTVEQVRMAGTQGGSACRVRLAGARAGYTWQGPGRVAGARSRGAYLVLTAQHYHFTKD